MEKIKHTNNEETLELVKSSPNLPVKIEDLSKFILFSNEKLNSVRAGIRAMDKLGIAKEVREQKLKEAQDLAGTLLDAETRIGELLKSRTTATFKKGGETDLPEGIDKNLSYRFQKLANYKNIVEQVKAKAVVENDLPTRTEVLKIIKKIEKDKDKEFTKTSKFKEADIKDIFDKILGFNNCISEVLNGKIQYDKIDETYFKKFKEYCKQAQTIIEILQVLI